MKRVATPNAAVDLFGAGKNGYRAGNKVANISPTELSAADMNAIQEELAAFPEFLGLVLDPNNNHQALEAVIAMIEARVGDYALDTGAANAYVVALNPAISAYTGNFFFSFKALNANTGASTINFGGGAVALNNDVGGALAAGDITAGMIVSGNFSFADNQARITSMVQSQGDARYVKKTDHGILPQNSRSANYTTVLGDAGKHLLHPSADVTARTFTIDSNANVPYELGSAIEFVNQAGAGVLTIAINADTMRLAGAGTTGSRTLAANGVATALKLTATEWIISGVGLT